MCRMSKKTRDYGRSRADAEYQSALNLFEGVEAFKSIIEHGRRLIRTWTPSLRRELMVDRRSRMACCRIEAEDQQG